MALPAIIGIAARSTGTALSTGARFAGRHAYAGLKTGLLNAGRGAVNASARNSPLLSGALSMYDRAQAHREEQRKRQRDEEERRKDEESKENKAPSKKNQEKSEQDERDNRERQEKAHEDALRGKNDEQTGVLKVISRDTKDILAGIELLVEEGMPTKEKNGGGLLSGIMSLLGGMSMFSKGFLPALGGFLAKTATKMGSIIAGLISKAIAGIFGTLGRAGGSVARVAASVGRVAAGVGGALAAKGVASGAGAARTGATASRVAGTTGGMVAKTAGRSALKKVPIIGAGVGLALAANRAMAGDWTGAGMEAASGAMSIVPGIGTLGSLGMDAAILARDMNRGGAPDFSNVESGSSTTPRLNPVATQHTEQPRSSRTDLLLESLSLTMRSMLGAMTSPLRGIYTQPVDTSATFDWDKFIQEGKNESTYTGTGQPSSPSVYNANPTGTVTPLSGNSSRGATGDASGLLDLIAKGESGAAGYDAVWNGSRVKPSKPVSEMTFGEVMQWQKDTLNEQKSRGIPQERRSSAAGRYQFISGTLKDTMAKAGFSEDDAFSPENQDKLALALLDANKNRGLTAWREGRASDADFINYVSSQWASIKNASGRGTYDAAGFNHAGIGGNQVIAAARGEGKPSFANVVTAARPGDPIAAQVRESVAANEAARRAPIVVSAPTTNVTQQKAPSGGGSGAGGTAVMAIRNPDSPIYVHALAMMATF